MQFKREKIRDKIKTARTKRKLLEREED